MARLNSTRNFCVKRTDKQVFLYVDDELIAVMPIATWCLGLAHAVDATPSMLPVATVVDLDAPHHW